MLKWIFNAASYFNKLWNTKVLSMEFILKIICLKKQKQKNDGAYVINFDQYADVGTHWIALYYRNIESIYFDSFGVEHVPKETEKITGHKNIKTNIFRV